MRKFERFRILFMMCGLGMFVLSSMAFADRLSLNSGKVIEGKIMDRGDDYVQFQIEAGMTLTFYSDEIESVEEVSGAENEVPGPKEVVTEEPGETAPAEDGAVILSEENLLPGEEFFPKDETVFSMDADERFSDNSTQDFSGVEEIVPYQEEIGPYDSNSVLDNMIDSAEEIEERQVNRPQELMRQIGTGNY